MQKLTIRAFLFVALLLSTEAFAKPRCDTAHLQICTRELLQGLIENNELNAHWDNGNYINGNLVVDGISYATTGFHAAGLNSVVDKHGWRWLSTNVFYAGNTGADILHATNSMISDVAKFYMGGTWHTIGAPMVVPPSTTMNVPTPKPSTTNVAPPKAPIIAPNKVPQPLPYVVHLKLQ